MSFQAFGKRFNFRRVGGTTKFLRKYQASVPPIIPPGPNYPPRPSRGIVYNLKRGRR